MSAQDAERAGLVSKVLPPEEVVGEAVKLGEKISGLSKIIVGMAKEAVNAADNLPLEQGISVSLHGLPCVSVCTALPLSLLPSSPFFPPSLPSFLPSSFPSSLLLPPSFSPFFPPSLPPSLSPFFPLPSLLLSLLPSPLPPSLPSSLPPSLLHVFSLRSVCSMPLLLLKTGRSG